MSLTLPRMVTWPTSRPEIFGGTDGAIERTLGAVRLLFAGVSLVAIYLDPTEPSHFAGLTYTLLAGYVAYSAALVFVHSLYRIGARGFAIATHVIDMGVAAALTAATAGATSPFFLYFAFVLLAAAYRWGYVESMWTCAASLILFGGASAVVTLTDAAATFELNRFVLRCTHLLVLAVMVGTVSEHQRSARAQAAMLADTLAAAQRAGTVHDTFRLVAERILQLFRAPAMQLLAEDHTTGRTYLWTAAYRHAPERLDVHVADVAPSDGERFEPPGSSHAAVVIQRDGDGSWSVLAPSAESRRLVPLPERPTVAPPGLLPFSIALSLSHRFADWHAQLFLFDPGSREQPLDMLETLKTLARYLAPVLVNAYLVGRLRSRITASERARVARELHDGAIQSLLGLRLQVGAIRLDRPDDLALRATLESIEHHLLQEVRNLRMLMFELTPAFPAADTSLVGALADLTERFERDSGISTRFVAVSDDWPAPPPRTAIEISRILQEALVNVQKHSGARHVLVRWSATAAVWFLVVDDDGQGFKFSGRKPHDELDRLRRGPRVIKERVRLLGGTLMIESTPGAGARLEISIPRSR